jgi:phage antirepressor YoqD-like protein
MSNLSKFNYNGSEITFDLGNDQVMANATEMVKPFKKQPSDFLRLKSTLDYIKAYKTSRGIPREEMSGLIHQKIGGGNPGTWMHEDVAMEFARWLSPEFAIWCNDRIKELLTHGFTATPDKLEELAGNPDLLIELATNLKKERSRRELAEHQKQLAEGTIREQAPKVAYHDEVLVSDRTYTTTTIAKELGTAAPSLHKELNRRGVMYRADGHWVLYHKYQGKGYTKTRTATYTDRYGNQQSTLTTVWTEKGREWLHGILKGWKS